MPSPTANPLAGAIVGGVVGGVVGLILISAIAIALADRKWMPPAPSIATSWRSGPSVGNPFDDIVSLLS